MESLKVQKSYRGRTAGGWAKMASIGEAKCGLTNIWIKIPKIWNCQAVLAEDGDLVIHNSDGVVVCLETSARAYRTLKAMESKAEEKNLAKYAR